MKVIEERDLWVRHKDHKDEQARDELVLRYMRIVRYIAGRMAIHLPPSIDLDDLIGWGVLGLLDAVDRFDPLQNVKFSTYATIRIRGAIIDQVRTLDWAPRSLRALARQIGTVRDRLRGALGTEPTNAQVAEELGMDLERLEDTLSQLQTAQVLSLDDYLPSDGGDRDRLLNVTSDAGALSPDQVASEKEKQELLVEAILRLPEQQQKVLHLYYYQELTLKEIGAVLEVTESRVCQIHSAAMKKLRRTIQRGE